MIKSVQEKNKRCHDLRRKPPEVYQEGDLVMVRRNLPPPGCNPKMAPKYGGPYVVKKVLDLDRYVVADPPTGPVCQKPYESILPPERLKKWQPVGEADDEEDSNDDDDEEFRGFPESTQQQSFGTKSSQERPSCSRFEF